MKMNKAKLVISAALALTVSAAMVKAEEIDMTQTRTQDRVRTEWNLQVPNNETAQARVSGENMKKLKQKKQIQVRNEYKKNIQMRHSGSASGSMNRQNMPGQNRSKK